jgi:hypothetical protein
MIKTIMLSMCLAASLLSLDARAQDARAKDSRAQDARDARDARAQDARAQDARAQDTLTRDARAQDERKYIEGPVTLVQEIGVGYGHFEEYIDWLNSTWKPTMEATKKAGIIIDYKVFSSTPPSPDHPDIILWITYKNMAALDRGVEEEEVAKKVIGSTEVQNKARVGRNEYRKVLRREYIREVILK